MSIETVTCQYEFTMSEFRRALACHRRHGQARWALMVVCIIVAFAIAASTLPNQSHQATSPAQLAIINLIPVIIIIGLFVYTFWFSGARAFKKSAFYDQTIRYQLAEDGLAVRTPLVESNVRWEVYGRVIEGKTGFILFQKGKRTINWLPKSGFESRANIDLAREILRRNVPDSKKLSPPAKGGEDSS